MNIQLIGVNSKYIHPAMGLFQLVANCKYPCNYFEATIKDSDEDILSQIDFDSNLIGFSIYIWNVNKITDLIRKIRDKKPNIKIVVGGPEVYFRSEFFLQNLHCDYVINNEGEESFNELIEFLMGKSSISTVSNLYYLEDNVVKFTYFKLPDITKIKHDYSLIKDFKNRVVYLESSRGCYFKCSYCMASLETKVRFFNIGDVKKDILYLLNNKAKTIKFLDRSFNVNKKYMLDILKFLAENDNNYTVFQFEIVGDMLDDEVIDFINNNIRKGYLRFEIGIQSTNEITTKAVCRKQNFEKLKSNIQNLKDVVTIHTDLIAGLPYENLERFKKTFNDSFLIFAQELQLGFLKELKGTKISNEKELFGYVFDDISPYEVKYNNFISNNDLKIIHEAEEGLEKYYNKGNFNRTMEYLFKECQLDPFETFRKLYLYNNSNMNKQHDVISCNLYECLKDDVKNSMLFLYIIKQDYLLKFNIRPKIWWDYDLDRHTRNKVYELISQKYHLDIQDLYNYGRLENYKNQYFCIVYSKNKQVYYYNLKDATI